MQTNEEKPVKFAPPDYDLFSQPKTKLPKRRLSAYDKRLVYILYFFTILVILGGILSILYSILY